MILSNLLEATIISGSRSEAVEQIKTILRLLLQKYSACLYLAITKIIKKQIFKFNSGQEIIAILSDDNLEILPFLVFLSEKTINPDIIANIVYLALFLAKHHIKVSRREEYIYFVIHVFSIKKEMIDVNSIKPMAKAIRKIRKQS